MEDVEFGCFGTHGEACLTGETEPERRCRPGAASLGHRRMGGWVLWGGAGSEGEQGLRAWRRRHLPRRRGSGESPPHCLQRRHQQQ